MPSCVSAGMATSQGIIHFFMRPSVIMSQGWTKTGMALSAQKIRKSTISGWSRSFFSMWLPICTPTAPAFMARAASAVASFTSCSATCDSQRSRVGCGAQ